MCPFILIPLFILHVLFARLFPAVCPTSIAAPFIAFAAKKKEKLTDGQKFNCTNICFLSACVCVVGKRAVKVQAQGRAGVFPSGQLQELLPQQQLPVGGATAGVSAASW